MTPRPPRKARAVRVEDELWEAAKAKAEQRGDVLSEVIREALKRYVRTSSGARSSVPRVGEPGSGRALGA